MSDLPKGMNGGENFSAVRQRSDWWRNDRNSSECVSQGRGNRVIFFSKKRRESRNEMMSCGTLCEKIPKAIFFIGVVKMSAPKGTCQVDKVSTMAASRTRSSEKIKFSVDVLQTTEGREHLQELIENDLKTLAHECSNVKAIRVRAMVGYQSGVNNTVVVAVEKKRGRERGRDEVEAKRKAANETEHGEESEENKDDMWVCEVLVEIDRCGTWAVHPSVGPCASSRSVGEGEDLLSRIASWDLLRKVLTICCGYKTCSGTSTIHAEWGEEREVLASLDLYMVTKPGACRATMRAGDCVGLMKETTGRNTDNSSKTQYVKTVCEKCKRGRRLLQRKKGIFECAKEKVSNEDDE